MRFLGNKESLLSEIESLLTEKNLLNSDYTFCDAFCGSGAVSNYVKKYFNVILNDNLNWAVIYAMGRSVATTCTFSKLSFDPFEFFNESKETVEGFFYQNYCPSENCKRMYFSVENAKRIDFFRKQIEDWNKAGLLSQNEYFYLLASLIESVSAVSNTAGVYGAFLKHWDSRALKPIQFIRAESNDFPIHDIQFCNGKIEEQIENINCDILYLDPPYTQNQYGTQYHLLETLVLNDNPSVSVVTGSRPTAPMRSDWSKDYKCHILFDRILAKTSAKYVILSYNNDGFMSKTFIEAAMKRYGKPETFVCKKIPYKKYQNWKSQNENEHFEYLFFVELKDKSQIVYESPLNYIGSKAKIVNSIKTNLTPNIYKFVDAFGGGFNVGINVDCSETVYNDNNFLVTNLIESFKDYDTYEYILYVKKIIRQFDLKPADKDAYIAVRDYYNSLPKEKRDPRILFTIILYGFQQQIRFNSNLDFNNPVGMR